MFRYQFGHSCQTPEKIFLDIVSCHGKFGLGKFGPGGPNFPRCLGNLVLGTKFPREYGPTPGNLVRTATRGDLELYGPVAVNSPDSDMGPVAATRGYMAQLP